MHVRRERSFRHFRQTDLQAAAVHPQILLLVPRLNLVLCIVGFVERLDLRNSLQKGRYPFRRSLNRSRGWGRTVARHLQMKALCIRVVLPAQRDLYTTCCAPPASFSFAFNKNNTWATCCLLRFCFDSCLVSITSKKPIHLPHFRRPKKSCPLFLWFLLVVVVRLKG